MSEDLKITGKTRLPEQVSEIILSYIAENNLKPGDKLPSERKLSMDLGVSSRSIRGAFKILQTRGFLEILHGKGAFVIDKVYSNFIETLTTSFKFTSYTDELLMNLVEVRKIIETAMIESVAVNRTDEDLQKLEGIVKSLDEAALAKDQDLYNTFDVAFHKTIIDCGKNDILISFYNVLIDLIFESFKKTGYKVFSQKEIKQSHRNMYEAIRSKDPEKAKELITKQLQKTEKTLRGCMEKK